MKYNDKEDQIFERYMKFRFDFDSIKDGLIELELEIQRERKVAVWQSMYELLRDSHAAEMYRQTFLDRNKREFDVDLDNGTNNARERAKAI